MMTQVFIERYELDVTNELSSLITFQLDDIKDFGSRNTSFSKTMVLPGTANNNKVFGQIYNLGSSNRLYDATQPNANYNYNAATSAPCIIFQNNIQAFKGVMRMLSIIIDNGKIEYEVAVFGEVTNLISTLNIGYLHELDFSAYDHTYNYTNIVNSWSAAQGTGYYYPLIDYGTYSAGKHDWDYRTFRPAYYVREIIDKMLTAAGFSFDSALFNTARFKSLIIPNNCKTLQKSVTNLLNGARTSSAHVLDSGTATSVALSQTSVVTSSSFTSTVGDSKFTYVGATNITLNLSYSYYGSYQALTQGYTLSVKKNGVVVPGTTVNIARSFNTTTLYYNFNGGVDISFVTGDYIEFVFATNSAIFTTDFLTCTAGSFNIISPIAVISDVTYGQGVVMNDAIPKNIKQIDFFTSIIKLFNLYVYEDTIFKNLLYIKPYVDFYSEDPLNANDWTLKVDRSKPLVIKPMSELNSKVYKFKYKSDSDYYNDLYQKKYSRGYGDFVFDSTFEFAKDESSFELIFSSTPLVGYFSEVKVYPTIVKISNSVEEKTDSNIRILQTKKVTGVPSWNITGGTGTSSNTVYGYAGHFNDPDAPSNDLNFGVADELFFVLASGDLSATQFNVYWSTYMAEITDKDSRLLTCYVYLTPSDIVNLDFSKYVNIDGVLWRLVKVYDWNASNPQVCKIDLLRVLQTVY